MPRLKDYDDDLLVDLIAAGELTYQAIARKVGLSYNQLRNILHGRSRPEMRERVEAAKAEARTRRLRIVQRAAKAAAAAPPAIHRGRGIYNDQELIELLAAGNHTYSQIARRLGISKDTVYRIATGRLRPELQAQIAQAAAGYQQVVRREGVRYLQALLRKSVKQGLEGDDEVARRCRNDVIKRVWIKDDGYDNAAPTGFHLCPRCQSLTKTLSELPEDLARQVADALEEDEPEMA